MSEHFPPRTSQRAPIQTRVRLRFDDLDDFEVRQCENLSLGGIFIRTDDPPPMGTRVNLEFTLTDATELIRGTGEVMWIRHESLDEDNQAGMGVRFLELSPGSRAIIFHAVDRHIQEGGQPFELSQQAHRPVKRPTENPVGAHAPLVPPSPATPVDAPEVETAPPAASTPRPAVVPAVYGSLEDEDIGPLHSEPPRSEPAVSPFDTEPSRFDTEADDTGPVEPLEDAITELHSPAPRRGARHLSGSASAGRSGGRRKRSPVAAIAALVVLLLALGALGWWWMQRDGDDAPTATLAERGERGTPPDPVDADTDLVIEDEGDGEIPTAPGTATGEAPVPDATLEDRLAAVDSEAPTVDETEDETEDPTAPTTGEPLSALRDISWRRTDAGTEVVLRGEGLVLPRSFTHTPLRGANPRELIRLRGIRRPYTGGSVDVGSPELQRVRTGYHPNEELHVVLDLADEGVGQARLEADGETLTILLPARSGG